LGEKMKLKAFRIMNYKCVDDSGEVPIGDYTVLVGKNESGKTAILRAIHKFNPATPMSNNGLREFPRKRFHEFHGDARTRLISHGIVKHIS